MKYLPGITLPEHVKAEPDLKKAAERGGSGDFPLVEMHVIRDPFPREPITYIPVFSGSLGEDVSFFRPSNSSGICQISQGIGYKPATQFMNYSQNEYSWHLVWMVRKLGIPKRVGLKVQVLSFVGPFSLCQLNCHFDSNIPKFEFGNMQVPQNPPDRLGAPHSEPQVVEAGFTHWAFQNHHCL